jgi:hypothetical protein
MPRFASIQAATLYNLYAAQSGNEPEYNNQTMVFVQSTTPTGWVRDSTYDESTIRITTGATVSSGGDLNFSSTMTSSFSLPYTATFPFSSTGTSITEAQTAAHTHTGVNNWRPAASAVVFPASGTGPVGGYAAPATAPTGALTTYASNATPSSHYHSTNFTAPAVTTANMAVKYVDVIQATKTPV